jgi:hypothetical protein
MQISDVAAIQNLNQYSANQAKQQVEPEDDIENALENASPELKLRKMLIDAMFGKKDAEKTNDDSEEKAASAEQQTEPPPQPNDSVTISKEAIELYNRQRVEINVQNPDENLRIVFESEERLKVEQQTTTQLPQQSDPIVIDLNGDGLNLTDVTKGQGVLFEITGDGAKEQVSWLAPSDGFLAYDRNGNGIIDSGRELFGDQNGAASGFEELAKFDEDKSGSIDYKDSIFNRLSIWQDLNSDGITDSGELKAVAAAGISSFSLSPSKTREFIAGNLVDGYAAYQTKSGEGIAAEVYLNYLA